MANVFKNDEQRAHWNAYNNKYSKENYKAVTIKFSKLNDKELIDYLENSGKPATVAIKDLIREKLGK